MITLGIDIGTSGVKVALLGDDDHVIASSSQPLRVSRPQPGFSEQAPEDWWTATCAGLDDLKARQIDLGRRVRKLMEAHGLPSVAAEGFQAPGVVVSHTRDEGLHTGAAFIAQGLQTAAGVPLMCDEPADFRTFRVGLFGLDKLANIERTVASLATALDRILGAATDRREAA